MHINENVLSEQHHRDQSSGGLSSGTSDRPNSSFSTYHLQEQLCIQGDSQTKTRFHLVATLLPPPLIGFYMTPISRKHLGT